METKKAVKEKDLLKEFEENPYNPDRKSPEDLVRIFYHNNISILPIVSKRGSLLGIIKKDAVISELSDIERVKNIKIDQFISCLMTQFSLDDLLPLVGNIKKFIIINLFGEIQGEWSRLDLFAACEPIEEKKSLNKQIEDQKEEQILEWIIYLILEHIPRGLYAINHKGKTIFYNSYFETIFSNGVGKEVDINYVEKSLKNTDKNEIFFKKNNKNEVIFYNSAMKFYYEKIPLISNNTTIGYLIFCDESFNNESNLIMKGMNLEGLSLKKMLDSIERLLLVECIHEKDYKLVDVAKKFKITERSVLNKIDKYQINTKKADLKQ